MAQNEELKKVKARIKALSERTITAGFTEAEAVAAATMVGRLLEQYGLSMDEIDVREEVCKTIRIDSGSKHRGPHTQLASQLAYFCDCKHWMHQGGRSNLRYAFFGKETDLMMVEYLYRVVTAALVTETKAFKRSVAYKAAADRRTASASFQRGLVNMVNQRLLEMRVAREAAMQKAEQEKRDAARAEAEAAFRAKNAERAEKVEAIHETLKRGGQVQPEDYAALNAFDVEVAEARSAALGGCSLIVLKGQLVEAEYEKLGLKLKSMPALRVRRTDHTATQFGRKAGERINLSRPVEGRATTALIG